MSPIAAKRANHPVFARLFTAGSGALCAAEKRQREQLMSGLEGTVVEVGCGSGVNFSLYPPTVDQVVAVEPEPYFRKQAARAATVASVDVRVVEGVAEHLPLPDASADAVVCSSVLCSVDDPAAALAEAYRVLRPGGQLHFLEHVAAESGIGLRLQRICDATFWPLVAGGCRCSRDTGASISAAGFEIVALERSLVKPLGILTPPAPHILGLARRPLKGESQA